MTVTTAGTNITVAATTVTTAAATITAAAAAAKSLQSCPSVCDPIDGSPPGSSIHGIFQVRLLECGAIAFSIFATAPLLLHSREVL